MQDLRFLFIAKMKNIPYIYICKKFYHLLKT